jgi:signal transduction histidine kinase
VLGADGSIRWVNTRGQVFFEGEGQFRKAVRFSGTALDISDRKRAEQSLLEAQAELERQVQTRTHDLSVALAKAQEVDRLKSEFLASMSHELRTPLNSIIGFSEIVLAQIPGPLNEEQKRQLGMTHSSARHLLHLINDLLDLARIESGRVDPSREALDPGEVVNEAMDVIRPLAERKGLLLDQFLDLPPVLHTDRKMFFQVLLNLLKNAVKFTEMGQVRIETKTLDSQLLVSVRDTGIGIKPDQKPMLFEAFRQIDGSARKRYEGTGLGLYLCRNILQLLGGRIWVESEFGKGSVFSFVLPLNFPQTSAKLRDDRGENLIDRG